MLKLVGTGVALLNDVKADSASAAENESAD